MEYKAITEDDPRASLMHWKYITKKKVNGKWRYVYEDPEKGKLNPGKDTFYYDYNDKKSYDVHARANDILSRATTNDGVNDLHDYEKYLADPRGYYDKMSSYNTIQGEIGKVATKKNTKTGVVSTTRKSTTIPNALTIQGEIKPTDKINAVSKTTISKGKSMIDKFLKKVTKKS